MQMSLSRLSTSFLSHRCHILAHYSNKVMTQCPPGDLIRIRMHTQQVLKMARMPIKNASSSEQCISFQLAVAPSLLYSSISRMLAVYGGYSNLLIVATPFVHLLIHSALGSAGLPSSAFSFFSSFFSSGSLGLVSSAAGSSLVFVSAPASPP